MGRSLLSKLSAPFLPGARTVLDFHIRPDEPHRLYSPGDLVKGTVCLSIVKPIRITHLVVSLHGYVQVYKSEITTGTPLEADKDFLTLAQSRHHLKNGRASLYEDECTLCGEGRLDLGIYEFGFELRFPETGLPSSIDFERGTITYMITSTLTRPTSIAPTTSCDFKLRFMESIDIAPLFQPKPRSISLKPISQRYRPKTRNRKSEMPRGKSAEREAERGDDTKLPGLTESLAAGRGSIEDMAPPRSPVPSEVAGESTISHSAGSVVLSSIPPALDTSTSGIAANTPTAAATSVDDKTITATIELLRAGCLRGDNFPLRIFISHTKPIVSLHGIIITLYRKGRIDWHGTKHPNDKLMHEDYYSKSKIGLGGLSLTPTGSSSIFRKDLSQVFAPLIVDPKTLTAEAKTSIRVPEEVFPTISSVPGSIISFKYFVEVVVDLGGKLAGQDNFLPRLGMVTMPSNYGANRGALITHGGEHSRGVLAAWGGSIIDTEQIRREKSVVACLFEVVIGTIDSGRGKKPLDLFLVKGSSSGKASEISGPASAPANGKPSSPEPLYSEKAPEYSIETLGTMIQDQEGNLSHTPMSIPVPPLEDEEGLNEKEKLKRAEARLLPSAPPRFEPESSSAASLPASLYLSNSDSVDRRLGAFENYLPSAPPPELLNLDQPLRSPSFQIEHNAANRRPPENQTGEDKNELEQRRLLSEASAPTDLSSYSEIAMNSGGAMLSGPSVPTLREDEYRHEYTNTESLPQYAR
ncbi:MAG: ph-response sensor protein [Trizodia sp. TS-e1964]|nr:MAG: ph-response sensor protein [Trizodia sp. TS-e1964]